MKPLNIFRAVVLVALTPLSASADRGSFDNSGPRRCGNDRSYNSYNSGWNGAHGGWGSIPFNPYGGQQVPRGWNSGVWSSGGWGDTGYGGYGGYGYGGGHPGIYRTDNLIRNGIRSGALSRDEVRDIREDQRDIREKEQRYWSDGWLSPRERKDLRGDYRDLNKDIRHNLNDGERRFRRR